MGHSGRFACQRSRIVSPTFLQRQLARQILTAYDRVRAAIKTGVPFETRLNPPADLAATHPPRA